MLNYVACSCHIYAQGWLRLISCLILYLAMASAFLKWLNRVVVGEPKERNEEATQRDAQDAAQESQQEMNKKVNMPEAEKEADTEGAPEEMERNEESKCDKATQREHTQEMKQEATQETNDMNTQQASSEEPVKQKDSDKQEEVTSPDTNQPVPKKEYNILIIPTTVTDCPRCFKCDNDTSLEDSFIVANHIVKKEREFQITGRRTSFTSAKVSFDYEVTHNDETYSFNIGYVRQSREIKINDNGLINNLAHEIPRYVAGLHLVIFVTSCTKSSTITESIIKYFPPEAQSISLLVVTQCNRDKNMSDKERKDIIEEFDACCGSYKMKKGIIPVCFRDGDFHLSGPRKGFHARRIREDEEILRNLIINQCEEMVSVKSILVPPGNESDSGLREW